MPFENYLEEYEKNDLKLHQDFNNLMSYSKDLNLKLHELKIKESLRSLLISGILLSLKNDAFKASYEKHKKPENLNKSIITTILSELKENNIQERKIKGLKREYTFIEDHEAFTQDVNILKDIVREVTKILINLLKLTKVLMF